MLSNKKIFFLFGAIVLSPLSTILFVTVLKMGINCIEVLMIPFLLYIFNSKKIKLKDSDLIIVFTCIGLLFVYSLLINNFSTISLISTTRAYFWLLFFFIIFKNGKVLCQEEINSLFWGSLIAWAFVALAKGFLIKSTDAREFNGYELAYGNALVGTYLIYYYYFNKKYKELLFLEAVLAIISLFAGLRRVIVFWGVSNSIIVMYILFSKSIKTKVLLSLFILLLIVPIDFFSRYMKENNALLYHRTISKTYMLFGIEDEINVLDNSDTKRKEKFLFIYDNIDNYVYPQGFISKRTSVDLDSGFYIDCPPAEFLYMFGWPICLVLLLMLYLDFVFLYKITNKFKDTCSKVLFLTVALFVFNLVFLDGTNIAFVNLTPLTGMILGMFSSLRFSKGDDTDKAFYSRNGVLSDGKICSPQ